MGAGDRELAHVGDVQRGGVVVGPEVQPGQPTVGLVDDPGDQGGPMTNGAIHEGQILQGDVDVWTFTATAGERLSVHIGEITDTVDELL